MIGNIFIALVALIVIGIVIIIIFGREDPKEFQKRVKYYEDLEKNKGTISSIFLIHLSGHPYLQKNDVVTVYVRYDSIYIENKNLNSNSKRYPNNFEGNEILLSQLIKYEVKTEKEIRRDVTLTRLVALGIFAFGVKKKTEGITQYLILTYLDNDVEVTCVLKQMQKDQELGNIISNISREKLKTNTI